MQEIKLWLLEKEKDDDGRLSVSEVEGMNQTETEQQLEEIIVGNPGLIMSGLMRVGRQTPTPGGPLDLLGVDEDGNLVVFELKRGRLSREAVAQVIDYASYISSLDAEILGRHISERSGTDGIDKIEDFLSWYQEKFPDSSPEDYTGNPRMMLVGLGVDKRTRRMVNFLAERGLDMSLITFYAFKKDDRQFLTRQVEVQAPEKPYESTYSYTKSDNLKALKSLAEKMDVRGLFDKMTSFFSDEFPQSYSYPGKTGYGYRLPEWTDKGTLSNRVYISIYIWENRHDPVELVFWNRAVVAAKEAFEEFLSQRRERFRNEHDSQRTWVKSVEDWENLAIALKPLLPEIISSWQAKMQTSIEEGSVEE